MPCVFFSAEIRFRLSRRRTRQNAHATYYVQTPTKTKPKNTHIKHGARGPFLHRFVWPTFNMDALCLCSCSNRSAGFIRTHALVTHITCTCVAIQHPLEHTHARTDTNKTTRCSAVRFGAGKHHSNRTRSRTPLKPRARALAS